MDRGYLRCRKAEGSRWMEQGWEGKECMPASLWVGVGNSADGPSTAWAQPPGLCGSRPLWVRPEGPLQGLLPTV